MTVTAIILYRSPERIFSAADRGEKVTIRRGKIGYVLTKKIGQGALYGCPHAFCFAPIINHVFNFALRPAK